MLPPHCYKCRRNGHIVSDCQVAVWPQNILFHEMLAYYNFFTTEYFFEVFERLLYFILLVHVTNPFLAVSGKGFQHPANGRVFPSSLLSFLPSLRWSESGYKAYILAFTVKHYLETGRPRINPGLGHT